jgi:hypothetical protein
MAVGHLTLRIILFIYIYIKNGILTKKWVKSKGKNCRNTDIANF